MKQSIKAQAYFLTVIKEEKLQNEKQISGTRKSFRQKKVNKKYNEDKPIVILNNDEQESVNLTIHIDEENETEDFQHFDNEDSVHEVPSEKIVFKVVDAKPSEAFICHFCSRSFSNKFRLKSHLRTHTNERPYKCLDCKMTFRQPNALRCHRRIHSGEKPYECQFCQKSFTQKTTMKTHLAIHTGKQIKCELCSKSFPRPSYLIGHMREHIGTRPYACHICPARYKQKSHLDQHISVHSGIRFQCQTCGKEYSKKWSLKVHMYSHEPDDKLPYRCEICGMAFVIKNKLAYHVKVKHKNELKGIETIVEDAPAPSNVVEVETRELIFQQPLQTHQILILTPQALLR